jgi:DNA-binding transcriptional regulator of glucitol operon
MVVFIAVLIFYIFSCAILILVWKKISQYTITVKDEEIENKGFNFLILN